MKTSNTNLFTRPLFMLALGLLLLNDWYLKYEYSNFLTGKLSDIAGLFLFPYFLSSFRIQWKKPIYIGTALLFLFWKSPFSQELIDSVRAIGIGFNRVVDYTDLFALFILPLSYRYFQKQLLIERKTRKYLTVPLGMLSLFAIWATSLPREKVDLNLEVNAAYEIPMSKTALFNSLQAKAYDRNTLQNNLTDSLFYLYFNILDHNFIDVTALSTITAIDSTSTQIRLDQILYGYVTGRLFIGVNEATVEQLRSISVEEFKAHFETHFIAPLKDGRAAPLYFDRKGMDDRY